MAAAAEQRNDVREVAQIAVQVHHQRRLAVHPERASGEKGAFDAMRAALPEHFAHRQDRLSADFVIDRNRVQVILDFPGRGQAHQDRELARAEPKIAAACRTLAGFGSHASIRREPRVGGA